MLALLLAKMNYTKSANPQIGFPKIVVELNFWISKIQLWTATLRDGDGGVDVTGAPKLVLVEGADAYFLGAPPFFLPSIFQKDKSHASHSSDRVSNINLLEF